VLCAAPDAALTHWESRGREKEIRALVRLKILVLLNGWDGQRPTGASLPGGLGEAVESNFRARPAKVPGIAARRQWLAERGAEPCPARRHLRLSTVSSTSVRTGTRPSAFKVTGSLCRLSNDVLQCAAPLPRQGAGSPTLSIMLRRVTLNYNMQSWFERDRRWSGAGQAHRS
jgi:hypothetical protein